MTERPEGAPDALPTEPEAELEAEEAAPEELAEEELEEELEDELGEDDLGDPFEDETVVSLAGEPAAPVVAAKGAAGPRRRRGQAPVVHRAPTQSELAVRVTDPASTFLVIGTVVVFVAILAYGILAGHGGLLTTTPAPIVVTAAPSASAQPSASASAGTSVSPAPSQSTEPSASPS